MTDRNYQHAGPRRHQWWRGPALPIALLLVSVPFLIWSLSWAVPLLLRGA